MLCLRPYQPSLLWLQGTVSYLAPLLVRSLPRLMGTRHAARSLTFRELKTFRATSLWEPLSSTFRKSDVSFDVFSQVMKQWVGSASLTRVVEVMNTWGGSFHIEDYRFEVESHARLELGMNLSLIDTLHHALCLVLAYGDVGTPTDEQVSEIIVAVQKYGAAKVAPYIVPGGSLALVGDAIANGIDVELLSSLGE